MAKSITITANEDGSFTVEAEPTETGAPEAPEGSEIGAQDMAEDSSEGEPSQTVASIDEALDIAKDMLGGVEEKAPMMDGEEDFLKQGFNQVRGTPEQQRRGGRG